MHLYPTKCDRTPPIPYILHTPQLALDYYRFVSNFFGAMAGVLSMKTSRKTLEIQGQHGIYNLMACQVSRHAAERFKERFLANQPNLAPDLLPDLHGCRKLGRNQNGTTAYITVYGEDPLVLIEQDHVILTMMTQEQFQTVMHDFGRKRWPRKPNRWLERIRKGTGQLP